MAPPTFPSTWAPASDAGLALGVSAKTLSRWRSLGLLQPGKHWRRKFPSTNSPVLYDVPAVDAVMRQQAARNPDCLEVA